MSKDTFYTDHWQQIEDERVARYEQMFQWRDAHNALLAPANIESGCRVLDYGSGPGFMAIALADIVGEGGAVHGADINARFVSDAQSRAGDRTNIRFHQVKDGRVPLEDACVDRVLCKNVLEYVPDAAATLAEFARLLEPGGIVHVLDSDWGFVLVEPWGKVMVDRFFEAASPAFKEPYIGRKLTGLLTGAGFVDIEVRMLASPDREGGGLSVLRNMRSYIGAFDTMAADEADGLLKAAEDAVAEGTFLFCLPQFMVTGRKS